MLGLRRVSRGQLLYPAGGAGPRGSPDSRSLTWPAPFRDSTLSAPPEHQLQSCPVGVRAGDPFLVQFEMRGKALPQLITGRAEGRAVAVRNQVIRREILASGFQPAQQGPDVFVPFPRLDRTEQCVLEDPVEQEWRGCLGGKRHLKNDLQPFRAGAVG